MLNGQTASQQHNTQETGKNQPVKRGKNGLTGAELAELGKNTRFKPGNNANPHGRKKTDLDLAKEARKHARKAIQVYLDVIENPEATRPEKMQAAGQILDRGYGTAPKSLDVTVKHDFSTELSNFLARLHREETGQAVENQAKPLELVDETVEDAEFEELDGEEQS